MHGQTIINVANGVYSTKAESDGLHLSSTSTFRSIDSLTVSLYFSSSFSVLVNYQITVVSSAQFWTKLQITRNDDGLTNAGSLVRYYTQSSKTTTGYWMDNLEPGHYTFEVHYKSTSSISMLNSDYQTAILQVMWFAGVYAVSDGVKCYPRPSPINNYGVFSPSKDLKVNLLVPYSGRVVIAGYQLSIYSSSSRWFTTRLYKNNEQLLSTIMSQGDNYYYNLNSLWMDYQDDAEYEFGVSYSNTYSSYFEDCQDNYQGNKNLYVMCLPSACRRLVTLRPISSLSFSTTAWMTTDLSYSFTLSRAEHIIVRYQYSTTGHDTFTDTRIMIDSVPIKHTVSIAQDDRFADNSGMRQGVLASGAHNIIVQQRSNKPYTHYLANGYNSYYYNTRAVVIVHCY